LLKTRTKTKTFSQWQGKLQDFAIKNKDLEDILYCQQQKIHLGFQEALENKDKYKSRTNISGFALMYLQILNQTLAEGNTNYNDGRFIRDKAIGQRFVGARSVRVFV